MIVRLQWTTYILAWVLLCPRSVLLFDRISNGLHSQGADAHLHGCNTVTHIKPSLDVQQLGSHKYNVFISSRIESQQSRDFIEKGCGRDTYALDSFYKRCELPKNIVLLPTQENVPDYKWIANADRRVTPRGGTDFIFNGKTAVRFPTKQLASDWFIRYSISGWILTKEAPGRQYILSWSDGDKPRHDIMGFYVSRKPGSHHVTYGFQHMHKSLETGQICKLHWKWVGHESNTRWHFFTLIFHGCTAEFILDGKVITSFNGANQFHLPEKHIQPKFVIGARYTGFAQKYDNYFHGMLSGMTLFTDQLMSSKQVKCLLTCEEKLLMASPLPDDLQLESSSDGDSIEISGRADVNTIRRLLDDVVYTNTGTHTPPNEKRAISFRVENTDTKKFLEKTSVVAISRTKSELSVSGKCGGEKNFDDFYKQGIRLCDGIQVALSGCTDDIESATVEVEPNMLKGEKIFVNPSILKRYELNLLKLRNGFILTGSTDHSVYTTVLQMIKYVYSGKVKQEFTRTIKVSVNRRGGLDKSNDFYIQLKVASDSIIVLPDPSVTISASTVSTVAESEEEDHEALINHILNNVHTMSAAEKYELARKVQNSTKGGGHYTVVVLSIVFSAFIIVTMTGYGIVVFRSRIASHNSSPSEKQTQTAPNNGTEFFWDEEGLPVRIQINPSERISITNDPYSEELLRRTSMPTTDSDGFASDDEGEDDDNDSDTDSIKQLEWDCLESSLDAILSDDEAINSLLSGKQSSNYDQSLPYDPKQRSSRGGRHSNFDAGQDTDHTTVDSDENLCLEFEPMSSSENVAVQCNMETRL